MPEAFASHHYPTTKLAPSRARTDCRKFLLTCGICPTTPFVDDLVLVVDELMVNAVTHGRVPRTYGRQIGLLMEKSGDLIRVQVRDTQSDKMPEVRTPAVRDEEGRGLLLVAELSDNWGVRKEVVGKTVWAVKKVAVEDTEDGPK
ncbi:hypothetical protein OK074_4007 [Actinobacteria bacterium OK074]|nr:hypothetical protein OK074_4007 [Actinobacteria bacterium OK074]